MLQGKSDRPDSKASPDPRERKAIKAQPVSPARSVPQALRERRAQPDPPAAWVLRDKSGRQDKSAPQALPESPVPQVSKERPALARPAPSVRQVLKVLRAPLADPQVPPDLKDRPDRLLDRKVQRASPDNREPQALPVPKAQRALPDLPVSREPLDLRA